MQVLPERKWVYGLAFFSFSAVAIYLHQIGFEVSNANVNVVVCMPFFLVGVFLKPMKAVLSGLRNYMAEAALLVVAVAVVYLCGEYNGYVWMYKNGFGNNFALYII